MQLDREETEKNGRGRGPLGKLPAMVRSVRMAVLVLSIGCSQAVGAATQSPDQQFTIGRLACAQDWDGRANGWRQLAWELMKRTSVEAELETRLVDPRSEALFATPFLLWSCPGPVTALDEAAVANLRRFLTLGGFLLIDDPGAEPQGAFDQSVQAALARLFPDRKLAPLAFDEVLFKTFFLIDRATGRREANPRLLGLKLDGRLAVAYSQNDLLGAVSRDLYGGWEFQIEAGGQAGREAAFRLGINLIFYGLCLDYKNDRVHLPFILKRRRL